MDSLRTDQLRLRRRMEAISRFGATPGGGVTRLALTDADAQARRQLMSWFTEAGCEIHVDAIGNVFAVLPGLRRDLPPLLTGSHGDSQPLGGRFDGMLGVVAGLEVVETLQDAGHRLTRDLVVANWTNEEGSRFTPGCSGSGVWAGFLELRDMLDLVDRQGVRLEDELIRAGFAGDSTYFPRPVAAAFELHIEQGPTLHRRGIPIGAPKGIVCLRWYDVTVTGVGNHAGPTPMDERRDALVAAASMITAIHDQAKRADGVVATVGEIHVSPNSRNVIPGRVDFTIDVRGWDEGETDRTCRSIEADLARLAARMDCHVAPRLTWAVARTPFDPALCALVRASAEALGLACLDMVSGASHDMIYLAKATPGSMIFVPSIDGRSHAEEEDTAWHDCAAGTDVLLRCLLVRDQLPD